MKSGNAHLFGIINGQEQVSSVREKPEVRRELQRCVLTIPREKETVSLMIGMYCKAKHNTKGLCDECGNLRDYTLKRLSECPHGEHKPSCRKCEIHCYKEPFKTTIKKVMRYAGFRMLLLHPVHTLRYLFRL